MAEEQADARTGQANLQGNRFFSTGGSPPTVAGLEAGEHRHENCHRVKVSLNANRRGVIPHFHRYEPERPLPNVRPSQQRGPRIARVGEFDVYGEVSPFYKRIGKIYCYLDLQEGEGFDIELEETQETEHTIVCAHFLATASGLHASYRHPRLQFEVRETLFFYDGAFQSSQAFWHVTNGVRYTTF